jgi:Transposase IS66 family
MTFEVTCIPYDSLKCRQQKCLVHLMRDINDELRRNPYDLELRSVAEPFAKLLKEIVLTIDRYGLRRRNLRKYVKPAERLCAAIAEREFTSISASKYQSRFEKYGSRLFTFLNYDGVPWNNNNAEHAVNHFAKLRRITDGTFTRTSLEQLLVLLTLLQTCEYRRVNPLKFLLSGRRQLDGMMDLPSGADFHFPLVRSTFWAIWITCEVQPAMTIVEAKGRTDVGRCTLSRRCRFDGVNGLLQKFRRTSGSAIIEAATSFHDPIRSWAAGTHCNAAIVSPHWYPGFVRSDEVVV